MVVFYTDIRLLVGKSLRHILLVLSVVGKLIVRAILGIVVGKHLLDCVLAHNAAVTIVDVAVENSHYVHRRMIFPEQPVVGDGFRNVLGGEHGVELAVLAQFLAALHDVVCHGYVVLVALVDVSRQISLNALHRLAVLGVGLLHLELVDEAVVDFPELLVLADELQIFFRSFGSCGIEGILLLQPEVYLMERHQLAQFVIVVGLHHVGVEAEHIAVGYSAGDGVFMEHVAEEGLRGDFMLGIFLKHRCACKAEEQSPREGVLDAEEHVAEHAAVALVDDEYEALLIYAVDQFLGDGSAA